MIINFGFGTSGTGGLTPEQEEKLNNSIERVELVYESNYIADSKNPDVALTFDEIYALVQDETKFVTLKAADIWWLLPSMDFYGDAIMFTTTDIISENAELYRVIINSNDEISDYFIPLENNNLKKDDLATEKIGNFSCYPTVKAVNDAINEIKLFKFPNATIMGAPDINHGQVSNFTNANYLVMPSTFNVDGRGFEISLSFTTGSDVTTPQNILGGKYCMALYIEGGKLTLRVSSNGTSWDLVNLQANFTVEANTTYYIKITFDRLQYKLLYSTNGTNYTEGGSVTAATEPYDGVIYIGVGNNYNNPFKGSVNLNKWEIKFNNNVVWQGMDDVGLASRLATDMFNIDEAGVEKVKEIAKDAVDVTSKLDIDMANIDEAGIEKVKAIAKDAVEFLGKEEEVKGYIKILVDNNDNLIEGITSIGEKINYVPQYFKDKLIISDGHDISSIEKIESYLTSITTGNKNFTNDGLSAEIKNNNGTLYPITKTNLIYDTNNNNLSDILSTLEYKINSKIENTDKVISWDNLSDTVKTKINAGGSGDVSFIPKDGDLSFEIINNNTYLKLYEKAPDTSKGIKYDYNNTDINNFFNMENTIYVLRYNHILNTEITIPNNSTLLFNGGSLIGNINMNNTLLLGDVNMIGSILNGSIKNDKIYSSWLCYRDGFKDDANIINGMIKVCNNIILEEGTYKLISQTIDTIKQDNIYHINIDKSNISIIGEGNPILVSDDHIKTIGIHSKMISISEVDSITENIKIDGITIKTIHNGTFYEYGHSIALIHTKNVIIQNCIFNNYFGDAIALTWYNRNSVNENIMIKNNKFISTTNNNRNAISIISGLNVQILSNYFEGGPMLGMPSIIDIEPESGRKASNIIISNNFFTKSLHAPAIKLLLKYDEHSNLIITNNTIENCLYGINLEINENVSMNGVIISNNICKNNSGFDINLPINENNSKNWIITNNILPKYILPEEEIKINKFIFNNNITL